MQTKYLSLLAAVAATTVSATAVERVDVIHIFETLQVGHHIPEFTPNKRSINAIFARDDKEECQSSAISILRSAPTGNSAITSWARTAETTDPCTLVAPSSISSDVMSYVTEVIEWANDKYDDMEKLIGKCVDDDDVNAGEFNGCSTPGTILFTADKTTETVKLETALATFATPGASSSSGSGSGSKPNAAAPRGANMFAAVVAVGLASFIISA
ncbi:infection structure specific protein [Fusarium austroafricanum]|uniref:Infection structure specific protein n=1 Tax=Fusarium austroafricanum TaxID=2364996 RepID=A0A8H4NPB7_9HYPO|nr:infection structure specific protein [Fusarium austroafricanum]